MDLGLRGRTALVTGGSGGIGAAIAVALGREGARVALTYRAAADRAATVAARVRETGAEAYPVPLDLTDLDRVDAAVDAVRDRFGGIDVLIAGAVHWPDAGPGLPDPGVRFEDADRPTWQRELRANLEGTFATVRAALPAMRGRPDGRIVFLSSGPAEEGGMPGAWSYCAAKAGLNGFARALAWELGPEGILVNVVAVGMTPTDTNRAHMPSDLIHRAAAMTLTGRLSAPEDVATLVTFLASPANRSVSGEVVREGSSTTRSFNGVLGRSPAARGGTAAAGIDTSRPSQARVWNHLLGGSDAFPVDRATGDRLAAEYPALVRMVHTTRRFLTRAVRHLAAEEGIRQFLDVGSGLPTAGNTHQIAQRAAPDARVVYVDYDTDVVLLARELLTSTPQGAADFAEADLREPEAVLAAAARTLDLNRPVALVLSGILGHVPDHAEACAIVRRLMAALPAGSFLLAHDISDTDPDWCAVQAHRNRTGPLPYQLRAPEQITGFFAGLALVEPGVLPLPRWRPDGPEDSAGATNVVGGVGRKP